MSDHETEGGIDLFETAAEFNEEEKRIRDTVRRFVDERVIPIIADHFENGTFPSELIPILAEMGLLGSQLPPEYGGSGLGALAYGLVMQELERGDSSLRSFVTVQGTLSMYSIYSYGTEEQKKKWLPRLAKAEAIGCFALTEPDHGSDPAGMVTTAREDSGAFVLNGSKMWITNGAIADVAIVWAKLDGEVQGFLVEKGTPGFTALEQKHKLSLRASHTGELYFNDCRIPLENRLPKAVGLKAALSILNEARFGISFGVVGAAINCFETALEYAKGRTQFDRPIAGFQIQQERFAEMATEITKAQLLCIRLAQLKDTGTLRPAQVSLAKRNNCMQALQIARMARQILGANGISLEYPVMRHLCNLETVVTYEGTHDIHTLAIGREVTGISAFK
ncbi:MAG: acyl-CoA dehydrogenase family protein [Candidatus Omnitrophica bacterium]|nr:acyl-CoA dehydrogenase family protein [Candidatus Omnitrophota bacterium]